MGLDSGNRTCVLCNSDMAENAEHLFSQCVWIMEIWNAMQIWTGIRMHIQGVQFMLKGGYMTCSFVIQQVKHVTKDRIDMFRGIKKGQE